MEFFQKRRLFGAFFILGLVAICTFYFACEQGLDPNFFKGTIKGRVRLNEKVPEQTDEIRVFALKTFPTLNLLALLEAADSGKLPLNKTDVQQDATFEIELPLLAVDAVIAIWKEAGKNLNPFDIVGGLCDENNIHIPIELTEGNPTADNITLDLDLRHINRTAKVNVPIRFEGTLPATPLLAVTFDDADAGPLNLCNGLPDINLLSSADIDSIEVNRVFGSVYDVAERPTLIRIFQVIPSPLGFRVIGSATVTTVKGQTVVADTIRVNF